MFEYKYTLCLIRQNNRLLMLNREAAPTKGLWNGVGGKIEAKETPFECVLREIYEETGIELKDAKFKGLVTWDVDEAYSGGMYVFLADIPQDYEYETPLRVDEGILDWKFIDWILSDGNLGVGEMIPHFLPLILNDEDCYEHKCVLSNNKLTNYSAVCISNMINVDGL
ncbi:NUDIX hydrolase [Paenibacillus herberti]|uniref:DNA mismatch repair protein MutT n=1 Tax=Paenibacillus herberti TaxID=1619309 RepID=A0A229NU10_9BACL|nr:8-oxo-dGTP diphosphatase [Paenibacillus herberti]OXM13417.1 DNA mismatch repair protein MutT [Paenibacillus herberti]